jgi:hypothetical protein
MNGDRSVTNSDSARPGLEPAIVVIVTRLAFSLQIIRRLSEEARTPWSIQGAARELST